MYSRNLSSPRQVGYWGFVMPRITVPGFAILLLALSPTDAHAFNYGFIRVPDWMDKYLIGLLLLQLPFWFGLMVTKPRDVPFNEMYRMKAAPVPTFFLRITQVLFLLLMVLFFVGMGLIRAAERGFAI
jgi:hypothetical protein